MIEKQTYIKKESAHEIGWSRVITPSDKWYDLNLYEIWEYRDLLWIFVVRSLKAAYKQTILGPLWFLLQPLATTLVSVFVFGKIANLSDEGVPQFLFFFCGISLWSFFSTILNSTSSTFVKNTGLFSKVYYPRLITPLSETIGAAIRLSIPFGIFLIIWGIYLGFTDVDIRPSRHLFLVPYYILLFIVLGNSLGIIISSLTTKYRDLQVFVGFGVQLLMYMSAVQYSIAKTPAPFDRLLSFNPLVNIMESTRYAFFGTGGSLHSLSHLFSTSMAVFGLALLALILFKRVEKNFIDTV